MEDAWTREIDDIAREFNVTLHTGLTESQVQQNLAKYGKNGTSPSPRLPRNAVLVCPSCCVGFCVDSELTLYSSSRGSTDPVMASCIGTVQGSVSYYIAWFGTHFIRIGTCGGRK